MNRHESVLSWVSCWGLTIIRVHSIEIQLSDTLLYIELTGSVGGSTSKHTDMMYDIHGLLHLKNRSNLRAGACTTGTYYNSLVILHLDNLLRQVLRLQMRSSSEIFSFHRQRAIDSAAMKLDDQN